MTTKQESQAGRPRRSILDKTKLCNFYMRSSCTRATTCRFAHGLDDLQPFPDLTCTKLCPQIKTNGVCNTIGCLFAHSRQTVSKPAFFRACDNLVKVPSKSCIRPNPVVETHSLLDTLCVTSACQQPIQKLTATAACEMRDGVTEIDDDLSDLAGTFTGNQTGSMVSDIDDEPWQVETVMTAETPSDDNQTGSKYDLASYPAPLKVMHQSETISKKNSTNAVGPSFNVALFLKTKICKFNAQGECKKGLQCGFAHNEAELRPLLDNPDTRDPNKTTTSRDGDDPGCQYVHRLEVVQKAVIDEPYNCTADTLCTWDASALHGINTPSDKAEWLLKTRLCKFHRAGFCAAGAKCRFVHDADSKHALPGILLRL